MANISLFGYGATTQALAKHFKNDTVVFYDDKVNKHFSDANGYSVKNSNEFNPAYSQLEIPSPGIPPHHTLITQSRNLISEYDYFSDKMPFTIWVSGTNGKTTTTQMITHILDDKDAISGGNIGRALGNMDQEKKIWVLETSSYTFHYTNRAKPNLYLLLPISDDHLSWHGSFEAYEKAKLKPLASMHEGEVIILPSKYKDIPTNAFCIYYESAEDLAQYFHFDTSRLNYKGGFLVDALLAMAVDKILFDRVNYSHINTFKLDEHRQEKVIDSQNRIWINDSKATNFNATLAALDAFEGKNIHLILGGDDKGANLLPLFHYLEGKKISLYLIGANEKSLSTLAQKYNITYKQSSTLHNAVKSIDKLHTQNSIALLSPAAASFDQFKNYQDRGDSFKRALLAL